MSARRAPCPRNMRDADAPRGPVNGGDAWDGEAAMSVTWERPAPRRGALSTQRSVVRKRLLRATAGQHDRTEAALEELIERWAGLDVHKETGAVCGRMPDPGGERVQPGRTVGTMPTALLALRDGLTAQGVPPVALESTGVSGNPGSSVREEAGPCLLAPCVRKDVVRVFPKSGGER